MGTGASMVQESPVPSPARSPAAAWPPPPSVSPEPRDVRTTTAAAAAAAVLSLGRMDSPVVVPRARAGRDVTTRRQATPIGHQRHSRDTDGTGPREAQDRARNVTVTLRPCGPHRRVARRYAL